MSEPVRTCPGQEWKSHPCEPADCPTPGACSASKVIEELRAKLGAVEDRNAVLRKDGEDLCTLLAKIRDKLAATEAEREATETKRLRAVASMEATSQDLVDAIAQRDKLATFARELVRVECWGYQPEIDGADAQDIAAKLGLIEEYIATEEDATTMNEVCAGDRIYRFAPWLDNKGAAIEQEQS